MSGTFHKQQKTPEGSERRGNLSREEEKMENRSESGRDILRFDHISLKLIQFLCF